MDKINNGLKKNYRMKWNLNNITFRKFLNNYLNCSCSLDLPGKVRNINNKKENIIEMREIIEGLKNIELIKVVNEIERKIEILENDKNVKIKYLKLDFFGKGKIINLYNKELIRGKVIFKHMNDIAKFININRDELRDFIKENERIIDVKKYQQKLLKLNKLYDITKSKKDTKVIEPDETFSDVEGFYDAEPEEEENEEEESSNSKERESGMENENNEEEENEDDKEENREKDSDSKKSSRSNQSKKSYKSEKVNEKLKKLKKKFGKKTIITKKEDDNSNDEGDLIDQLLDNKDKNKDRNEKDNENDSKKEEDSEDINEDDKSDKSDKEKSKDEDEEQDIDEDQLF